MAPSEQAMLAEFLSALDAGAGIRSLWRRGDRRAGAWPDDRRLHHRQRVMALDILHQRADRRALARGRRRNRRRAAGPREGA